MATEDPGGSGPQIALRFLRDLQTGRVVAAATQLSVAERSYVALHSKNRLLRIMADVAANAQLGTAGPCTSATPLTIDAAVVTCGSQPVVVHVRSGWLPGVQIDSYFPHEDVYLGPHTHAYTRYDI